MTREEIERRMDELARKYVETHNPEIPEELHRLRRLLGELESWKSNEGPSFSLVPPSCAPVVGKKNKEPRKEIAIWM
jgi:hypothetical protein